MIPAARDTSASRKTSRGWTKLPVRQPVEITASRAMFQRVLDHMERKYISIPMKLAKEIILEERKRAELERA